MKTLCFGQKSKLWQTGGSHQCYLAVIIKCCSFEITTKKPLRKQCSNNQTDKPAITDQQTNKQMSPPNNDHPSKHRYCLWYRVSQKSRPLFYELYIKRYENSIHVAIKEVCLVRVSLYYFCDTLTPLVTSEMNYSSLNEFLWIYSIQ